MPVAEFVGVIGSFASMIGLSVQLFDRAKKGPGGKDDERVGLYVALTDVTRTWKMIHNHYHVLSPEIRGLARNLSDGKGNIKEARYISDGELYNLFRNSPQLVQQSKGFKSKLEVYFSEPRTKIELDPAKVDATIREIRQALDLGTSQAAANVQQAQRSAIQAHDSVCTFLDTLAPLLRRASWGPAEKEAIIDGFLNVPSDFDSVILDCDIVLLNVIDLYEYVSRDLLGIR